MVTTHPAYAKLLLIGSAAYKDDYRDIDILCTEDSISYIDSMGLSGSGLPVDVLVAKPDTTHWSLLHSKPQGTKSISGIRLPIASIDVLISIKKAHLILPHKWNRHIAEYQELKKLGAKVINSIFLSHRSECLLRAKKHPKLNVNKGEFFSDDEKYNLFDHDDIHRALAYPLKPAYLGMIDGEVKVSKKLWDSMPYEEQLRCVIEEASILALERALLPAFYLGDNAILTRKQAYEYSLQKICTTITSGWFRDFCIESYPEALTRMPDLLGKFLDGIKRKEIKITNPQNLLIKRKD